MTDLSIAENLNQDCEWVTSSQQALELITDTPLNESTWVNMLAKHPVFVDKHHIDTMTAVIETITSLSKSLPYQSLVKPNIPAIAAHHPESQGVLFGYDFHLTEQGPKLIEVNTNAGAIYFNHYLNQSQQACCDSITSLMRDPIDSVNPSDKALEAHLLEMFRQEFALQYPGRTLTSIAIVDERPHEQFLYPEFCLFKNLFERAGIRTVIVDPSELSYDGERLYVETLPIDLIYNRHTDFYLEQPALSAIKTAYLKNQITLTPHPHAYGFAADKRLLSYWSDPDFLATLNLDQDTKDLLLNTIPKTVIVTPENANDLWRRRKQLFFKPMTGFGSRASYHGAKLTQKTWAKILSTHHYIAQEFVPPTTRLFGHDGELKTYKMDLRNYTYAGKTLLLSARLYRGQTTNMKTPGGGFATVYKVGGD